MSHSVSSILGPWANFFIIAASSASALTGLMFVVITLVMDTDRARRNPAATSTFSTPTVVHFAAALLVSAVLSIPWRSIVEPALLLGVAGLTGMTYMVVLADRARRLPLYTPDLEDWTWYTALP